MESGNDDPQSGLTGRNRRTFINRLWAFFGVLACIEVGWLGSSILRSRKTRSKSGSSKEPVEAGSIDDFKPGSVTPIPRGQFYLACLEDGSFLALSRTCTHLGCSVPWDDKELKFICPCHGSTFNMRGEALTSPATRPLDYYPLRIENGMVKVFASTGKRRDSFKPEQTVRI